MAAADLLYAQAKTTFMLVSFLLLFTGSSRLATALTSDKPSGHAAATILPAGNEGNHNAGPLEGPERQLLQDNSSTLCYRQQVQCPSGIAECFDAYKACDGVNDCSDGSDEAPSYCATYSCPAYKGKCPSGVCTTTNPYAPHTLDLPYLCNGVQDCPDNSDEAPAFCATYDCSSEGDLTCPGVKECIPALSSANTVFVQAGGFIITRPNSPTSICDGVNDCSDGSDESPDLCASYACPNDSYKCGNICIAQFRLCDGRVDCSDGSDEAPSLCGPSYNCSLAGLYGLQHCPSGSGCYNGPQYNCDGHVDCLDGSDEAPGLCSNATCDAAFETQCPSGVGCVGTDFLCDGIYNCLDKSDERADVCANVTCASVQVKCPSGNGGCLYPALICDGTDNCLDGSDESDATCRTYDCGPGRTRCPSGVGCVDTYALCDGIPKNGQSFCKDGSDEDPAFCANQPQCPGGGRIRCRNGTCVNGELCDGVVSCADTSDEDTSYCQTASCPLAEQKCADGIHCVGQVFGLCNGIVDCPDGSDESVSFCSTYQCNSEYDLTKCPGGSGQCVPKTYLCDGVEDCTDGSDETPQFCSSFTCGTGQFRCPGTNVCVFGQLCNGYPDCPDHSDESQAVCNPGAASPPESSKAPPPTVSEAGAPPPVSASPPQTAGSPPPAASCDPNSSLPNQCFNAQGTESICCPGQCPNNPGDAPACGDSGPSPATCDPSSPTPNECFNANGNQSVCCPGSCPESPGPVAQCG